jgi:hypothetical protein
MRRLLKAAILPLALFVMVLVAVGADQPASAQVQTHSLADAIDQGLVEVQFTATGSASGSAALLQLRRTNAVSLTLSVPAGMVLLNENEDEQDLVVRRLRGLSEGGRRFQPLNAIVLTDDNVHAYVLEAYCLEARAENPSEGASLTFGGFVPGDLQRVLTAVDAVPDAVDYAVVIQAAVWALTDDLSAEELDEIGYSMDEADLDLARAIIKAAGLRPEAFQLFS